MKINFDIVSIKKINTLKNNHTPPTHALSMTK
jgi:hypothetical protein